MIDLVEEAPCLTATTRQEDLDAALERAMDMCPICNALTGTDIRVTVRTAVQ
ncbi:MAG TPA: hypothetical protein VHJ99_02135 [Candidatus Dormibacteraeota bacterium]|nr:hypothetical protein [Candidatus Dormibacteraeota bacterium]